MMEAVVCGILDVIFDGKELLDGKRISYCTGTIL